ncbi:hypothetical protein LTR95_002158 [Oleoguttula sp. CCFEE 5521]
MSNSRRRVAQKIEQIQSDPKPPQGSAVAEWRPALTAIWLTVLAALVSNTSQLSLAPVFGSIPSSVNHTAAVSSTFLTGSIARAFWKPRRTTFLQYLPLWAACMPVVATAVILLSDDLGLILGPMITGFLSCHTIVTVLSYAIAMNVEQIDLSKSVGTSEIASVAVSAGSLGLFVLLDRKIGELLPSILSLSQHLNPLNLQVLSSLALGAALPQRQNLFYATVLVANVVALLAPQGSGPYSLAVANAGLGAQNWTLLARRWSNTGYISVLENTDQQYRVLRCDHSLLGGEWQLTPERRKQGWQVSEPIYAVFEMLEAVRLLKTDQPIPDKDAKALVIGLGIGTAPKALISHGINTTIIELDPVVHQYASTYFDLPPAHAAYLSNAIPWVQTQSKLEQTYDYILHDVFTGGAEPLALFTTSFLQNLRSLLSPNGIAAINYAGDVSLPLTALVLNTIDLAFDRQCSAFRDQAPAASSPAGGPAEDFTNLVVFCRNTPGPFSFRQPREADLLRSQSRRQYLLPNPDLTVDFPLRSSSQSAEVLEDGDMGKWRAQQQESAARHWRIMRTVLPSRVWELY